MSQKFSFPASSPHNAVAILGPTACGKTRLAVSLAAEIGGEIISADSRQVYRGLDIASGKDLAEYRVERVGAVVEIPHHLIDVADLSQEYCLFDFQKDFAAAFEAVSSRGNVAILCGGTGLYADCLIRNYGLREVPENAPLRASLEGKSDADLAKILRGLKPNFHNSTDLMSRERLVHAIEIAEFERSADAEGRREDVAAKPAFSPIVFCLTLERSRIYERIGKRLSERLDGGLIDEIAALHSGGVSWERLDALGLECRWTSRFLQGQIASRDELFDTLFREIRHFAKRQETWFRGMEKKGVRLHRVGENVTAQDLLDEMARG